MTLMQYLLQQYKAAVSHQDVAERKRLEDGAQRFAEWADSSLKGMSPLLMTSVGRVPAIRLDTGATVLLHAQLQPDYISVTSSGDGPPRPPMAVKTVDPPDVHPMGAD